MKKLLLILCLLAIPACALAKTAFELGKEYFFQQKYDLSKTYLTKESKLHPTNYECHYYLGLVYNHLKDNESAKREFKTVLSQAPKHTMIAQYATSALNKLEPQAKPQQPQQQTQRTTATPTTPAKPTQAKNVGDNYFNVLQSSGKMFRWKSFPVKVYIGPYEHTQWVKRAFREWEKDTKGLVSFTYTTNKAEAQITVSPTDNSGLPTNEGGLLLGTTTYRYNPTTKLLANADIKILRKDPTTKTKLSGEVVYSVIVHEIGHALGISGHSPKCTDIMATGCTKKQISEQTLSARDVNTLRLLYNR